MVSASRAHPTEESGEPLARHAGRSRYHAWCLIATNMAPNICPAYQMGWRWLCHGICLAAEAGALVGAASGILLGLQGVIRVGENFVFLPMAAGTLAGMLGGVLSGARMH